MSKSVTLGFSENLGIALYPNLFEPKLSFARDSSYLILNTSSSITITLIEKGTTRNSILDNLVSVSFPDTLTSIGNYAFYDCKNLLSLTLSTTLKSIGNEAFFDCQKLSSLTIPDSVTSIGFKAFYNCILLKSLTLSNTLKSIRHDAFYNCQNLLSLTIPDSVTSIELYAFYNCNSLTSLTIPNSVTSIGMDAFRNGSNLTSLTIPDSVTSIGQNAFYDCYKLTTINLNIHNFTNDELKNAGFTPTQIGSMVSPSVELTFSTPKTAITLFNENLIFKVNIFNSKVLYSERSDITSLTRNYNNDNKFSELINVKFPSSVTSIGTYAFNNCQNLSSLKIPNSVTSIGASAFSGCQNLSSLTLSNTLTSIGNSAFSGCQNLSSLTIPNSVTSIGANAFQSCNNLSSLTISNSVTSIQNNAFYNCQNLLSLTIPDSVTSIELYAFYNCNILTSLTIPDSVKSIELYAFYKCSNLTSLTLSTTLKSIQNYAFFDCQNLSSLTIPNSVTSIGNYAFNNCQNLLSLIIPDSVTSIGTSAFSGCQNLLSLTIPDSVKTIGDNAFFNCNKLTSLTIPNSVTSIGIDAFRNGSNLTSLTIPDSVTSIGENAFYNCFKLTTINLNIHNFTNEDFSKANFTPSQIDTIVRPSVELTFSTAKTAITLFNENLNFKVSRFNSKLLYSERSDITSLTQSYNSLNNSTFIDLINVKFLTSVKNIKDHAFSNCQNLSSLTIPNSVTSIGTYAFYNCKNLLSLTIPDSVTSIGTQAFYDCQNLSSLTLSTTLKSIQDSAFQNCNNLSSLTIPDSVTSIGTNAFQNCINLSSLTLSNTLTSIQDSAFAGCHNLSSLKIPDSVTSIGTYAFMYCSNLSSLTLSNTLTSIGVGAFLFCQKLSSLTIPNSVKSIQYNAFHDCQNLTSLTIPNSVTSIGENAFYNCNKLTTINLNIHNFTNEELSKAGFTPTQIDSMVGPSVELTFSTAKTAITLFNENLNFKVSRNNSKLLYSERSDITSLTRNYIINDNTFSELINIKFSNTLKSIQDYAFLSCLNLTSLTIPNSVTSIELYAFYNCQNLSSLTLSTTLKSIQSNAFSGCLNLSSLIIPNSVTSIQDGAFYNCNKLTSLTLSTTLKSIENSVFYNCQNLSSLTIPASVKSIGQNAFFNCNKLSSLIIPASLTSIGVNAFAACQNLSSLTIPASVKSIGQNAFYGLKRNPGTKVNKGTISASLLRSAGFKAYHLKQGTGWLLKDYKPGGFTASDMLYAGFNKTEILAAGYSENEYIIGGVNNIIAKNAGKVVDGYIKGASGILYNMNNEEVESFITDAKGGYSLSKDYADLPEIGLLEFTGGIDVSTGKEFTGTMKSIFRRGLPDERNVLVSSPLSTLLTEMILQSSDSQENINLEVINNVELNLSSALGIDVSSLNSDFIESENVEVLKFVQQITLTQDTLNSSLGLDKGSSSVLSSLASVILSAGSSVPLDLSKAETLGSLVDVIAIEENIIIVPTVKANASAFLEKSNTNISSSTESDFTKLYTSTTQFKEALKEVLKDTDFNSNLVIDSLISKIETKSTKIVIGPVKQDAIPLSDICFPGNTLIKTDQGELMISKLVPGKHTIRNRRILGISKTVSLDDYLVKLPKDSLYKNVPCRDTLVSKNHLIYYKGRMVKSGALSLFSDKVRHVKYSGEVLYNVIMEEHDMMMVNNLLCETLDPSNALSRLTLKMNDLSDSDKSELVRRHNKFVRSRGIFKC